MSVTRKLADFISETEYEKIPREALDMAKRCIIDCLGVTLAGSAHPVRRIMKKYLEFIGGSRQSTVIGLGLKSSIPATVFANGTMGHILDYDDSIGTYIGHPTVTVLPAVLALGELQNATGKDVLTAFSVAFDVQSKIGRSVWPSTYQRGFHTTGTIGTFGAVAAAGKMLDLNAEEMTNAFGIAGSEAAGLKENFGTMTKSFHAGKANENGVLAALLAKEGFTSSRTVLEGKEGFCRAFSDSYDIEKTTRNIGRSWEILDPGPVVKLYPSCGGIAPALDVTIAMAKEYDLKPENVETVRCGTNALEATINRYSLPITDLEAKFSFQFCVAIALLRRQATINEFTNDVVRDPMVVQLMKKVEVYIDPDIDRRAAEAGYDYSKPQPSTEVTIKMKDGEVHRRRLEDYRTKKGGPSNPLTLDELTTKYRTCARLALPPDEIESSIELLMRIEKMDDVNELMEHLRRG